MSVDGTTQAQLEAPTLYWRVLCYADFQGDVLRATSGIYDKTISASSDSELDGTYQSINHELIEVGPVQHSEQGAETVTISLSGLIVNDASFLTILNTKSNWQGRTARLWFYCVDEDENQVGSIIPYYTGYMDDIIINGSPQSQTVSLQIENYLASLSGAGGKTYLMQTQFDSGDNSPQAMLAAANGARFNVNGSGSGGGGGGRDGGSPGTRREAY